VVYDTVVKYGSLYHPPRR